MLADLNQLVTDFNNHNKAIKDAAKDPNITPEQM